MKPSFQLELFDLTQYDVRARYAIEDDCSVPDNSLTQPETLTKPVSELFVSVGEPGSINSLTEPQTLTESVSELFAPASGLSMDAVNLYHPAGTAKGCPPILQIFMARSQWGKSPTHPRR